MKTTNSIHYLLESPVLEHQSYLKRIVQHNKMSLDPTNDDDFTAYSEPDPSLMGEISKITNQEDKNISAANVTYITETFFTGSQTNLSETLITDVPQNSTECSSKIL